MIGVAWRLRCKARFASTSTRISDALANVYIRYIVYSPTAAAQIHGCRAVSCQRKHPSCWLLFRGDRGARSITAAEIHVRVLGVVATREPFIDSRGFIRGLPPATTDPISRENDHRHRRSNEIRGDNSDERFYACEITTRRRRSCVWISTIVVDCKSNPDALQSLFAVGRRRESSTLVVSRSSETYNSRCYCNHTKNW